jgi:hypothetical protein
MKRFAHKATSLFTVILLLTLALPISALADGGTNGNELTQSVNGYQVTLIFEKPAAVGENQIHVLVIDSMNMPISQANLEVGVVDIQTENVVELPTATADAMSGMAGMSGMDAQPTIAVGKMAGMISADDQPAQIHTQMGIVAPLAGPEGGVYLGQISIENEGDLIIRIHLTTAGKLTEADFPVHVAKSNAGAIVLGSFFAANVTLIAAAVVMKPKPVTVNPSKKA